jgi:hypothetical protein
VPPSSSHQVRVGARWARWAPDGREIEVLSGHLWAEAVTLGHDQQPV